MKQPNVVVSFQLHDQASPAFRSAAIITGVWAHKYVPTGTPAHVLRWIDLVWAQQDYELAVAA